jgi:hypothetical protein
MELKRSESIAALVAALSAAQSEIRAAAKDSTNPHFQSSYADLASVWECCREPLTKQGLAVIQLPSADGTRVTVVTILAHKSGEFIAGELTLSAEGPTPQKIGSAVTYGRRYGLAAIVGVAPDDDDDAEGAEGRGAQQKKQPPKLVPAKITKQEQDSLFELAGKSGKTAEQAKAIIERFGFRRSADITKDKYAAIRAAIEEK